MASTSMSKAGMEPGCKVKIMPQHLAENERDRDWYYVSEHANPNVMAIVDDQEHALSGGSSKVVFRAAVTRDFKDAQAARQRRYATLIETYPDAYDHSETDTLERFCIPCGRSGEPCSYVWADTFEEVANEAAGYVWDDQLPQAAYDLDTGEKIELHYGNPVLTRSEDQGATINELDPAEVAEWRKRSKTDYDLIGIEFAVSITCPPENAEAVRHLLGVLCGGQLVENAQIREGEIRQLRSISRIDGSPQSEGSVVQHGQSPVSAHHSETGGAS